MAKRGTLEHPKNEALAARLGTDEWASLGLLEALWHWTGKYASRGDVGRYPDESIAKGIKWSRDPKALVAILVVTGWVDVPAKDRSARLVIHDHAKHADDTTKKAVKSKGQEIWSGEAKVKDDALRSLGPEYLAALERFESERRTALERLANPSRTGSEWLAIDSRTACESFANRSPLPEPVPEPEPEPEPEARGDYKGGETRHGHGSALPLGIEYGPLGIEDGPREPEEPSLSEADRAVRFARLQMEKAASAVAPEQDPVIQPKEAHHG